MNTLPIVLDGSKFKWSNGRRLRGDLDVDRDYPGFFKSGSPPKQVAVHAWTGAVVVFDFVASADGQIGGVRFDYEGTLPDGRHCDLSLWSDD
jgi:hypothetical protein